ncbi:hypothetical protein GCM10023189_38270 [Nibrella saemangeumensis]|uniref:Uncharacterized protein n=1 Tax=Nibrella saemangeumensis TaxID=1084526 RepID=A0ABP8N9D4_9BACT
MLSEFQLFALMDDLERKVNLLAGINADARRRIEQLELEKSALEEKIQEQQTQLRQLQKKAVESPQIFLKPKDFGKIVQNNLTDTVNSTEIKRKLDEYIREIDRCIAHLSSLS